MFDDVIWWFRICVNPLSANRTKWSNTLKQVVGKLPTNCLSVFDHFVKLSLKELSRLTLLIIWAEENENKNTTCSKIPEVLLKLPLSTVSMSSLIFEQILRELLFFFKVLLNFMLLGLYQLTLTCSKSMTSFWYFAPFSSVSTYYEFMGEGSEVEVMIKNTAWLAASYLKQNPALWPTKLYIVPTADVFIIQLPPPKLNRYVLVQILVITLALQNCGK